MKKIFLLAILVFFWSGCGVSYEDDERKRQVPSKEYKLCVAESDCVKYDLCKGKGCQCSSAGKCLAICHDGKACVGNEKCFEGEGCFDIRSDSRKCGKDVKSAMECRGGVCSDGECSTNCGDGLSHCRGKCVNLESFHLKEGRKDAHGVAECTECAEGWEDCNQNKGGDGCEINIMNDNKHCGGCGKVCALSEVCSDGKCVTSCGVGVEDCGGKCMNLGAYHLVKVEEDNAECLTCEDASGVMGCVECAKGWGDCDGDKKSNGCEVNTDVDVKNCGGCGIECKKGEVCSGGRCGLTCQEGMVNCDGKCVDLEAYHLKSCEECVDGWADCSGDKKSDGCEVNLESLNMRGCEACKDGYANCDGKWDNGCEVYTQTDVGNCGGCGVECSSGQVCTGGECMSQCPDGQALCDASCVDTSLFEKYHIDNCEKNTLNCVNKEGDKWQNCDGKSWNGCEVNMTNVASCGKCEQVVDCGVCKAGYANCDSNWANGCEVRLSERHWSSCGVCVEGWGDCDGNVGNGCESHLGTLHMTGCGQCASGWGNCDGDWVNGCESHLGTLHMTGCGQCASGYSNCDGRWDNGCEVKLDNMEGCGKCKSGYSNCDGNWSNGCEKSGGC